MGTNGKGYGSRNTTTFKGHRLPHLIWIPSGPGVREIVRVKDAGEPKEKETFERERVMSK